MTAELCRGLPPEYWDPYNDGARFALAICRTCPARPECLDGDPKPAGVIRAGIAFMDDGDPFKVCPTCGYPQTAFVPRRPDLCPRCDVPSVSRWRSDVLRWLDQGLTTAEAGKRIGANARQIRQLLPGRVVAGEAA